MLFDTGRNSKNIRIENNVFGRKTDLVDQQVVSPFADIDFTLVRVGLPLFIECHHDNGCTITAAQFGVMNEFFFTVFQ